MKVIPYKLITILILMVSLGACSHKVVLEGAKAHPHIKHRYPKEKAVEPQAQPQIRP